MEPLELRLPADPAALSQLRQAVRTWLEGLGMAGPDVAAIVAATSEVAAGAVESVPSPGTDAIEITAAMIGADVVVRCTFVGEWRLDEDSSRYVAALLVDDVSIDSNGVRTSVVLRKAFDFGLRDRRNL